MLARDLQHSRSPYVEGVHDDPSLEARARALLSQLSLPQKLDRLQGDLPYWQGMADTVLRDGLHRHPWPAGGLRFVDGPRGVVLEGGATTFPVPLARGASWDVELEERIGVAMAQEARSFGANLLAAVCVNLLRHPGWGRAQETYGEDPLHVGAMGAAITRGIQRHGVACVKHFALNSIDSARFRVDVRVTPRVLHELYLPQFRDCVEAGALAVMSAYNKVNGEWCGQHPELLDQILKRRWGFRGFVVSDFIFGFRDGVKAVLAGLDLEMPFRMLLQPQLGEAVAAGTVPLSRIDDAVLRLLRAELSVPAGSYDVALRGCPAHRALAREAACKAIVLLKHDAAAGVGIGGRRLLPLPESGSVALIGPLAAEPNLGDHGSSDTRPPAGAVITPLAGLRAAAPQLELHHHTGANQAEAVALAHRCDTAVLVLGLDWRHEGEHIQLGDVFGVLRQMPAPQGLDGPLWRPLAWGLAGLASLGSYRPRVHFASGDRTDLRLEPRHEALVLAVAAANPRTVVVLMGGGAIVAEAWRHAPAAILQLWYPGQEGGAALADVLLGRVSPGGRMPYAVPTAPEHLPPFDPRAQRITYDLWHGYRHLQRQRQRAAFPFGFGLSYTSFAHGELALEPWPSHGEQGSPGPLKLSLSVVNTGTMAGAEVVQIYVEPPAREVPRPRRQLVAFRRLELDPGERRRLELVIPLRRLAYFDAIRDAFVLEAGRHRLVAARHADHAESEAGSGSGAESGRQGLAWAAMGAAPLAVALDLPSFELGA